MPLSTESLKPEEKEQPTKAAAKPKAGTLGAALAEAADVELEKREENKRRSEATIKYEEKYGRVPLNEDEMNEFLKK